MDLTRLFIVRPIMTTLVMIGILLAGIVGYRQLPVSDLPNVDFPTITVSASLPGANPDTMAAAVATPLEQQFATIDGLDSMNSSSSLGSTSITLQFNLNRNLDAAAQDVQAAISTASRKLPPNMPSPPSLRKVNPGDVPVIFLTLASSVLPMSQVDDYAEKTIAQRISMVSGVAQVSVYGAQKYAVRIQLNPLALFARNLGLDEVAQAIQSANVNLPIGVLYGDKQNVTVKANGQLTDAAGYRSVILAYRNGAPVQLQDVAQVQDSVENIRQASWFNKSRAVILAVQKQPGTNTIALTDGIKEILPTLEPLIPPSVKLGIMYDRSLTIRKSVDEVQFTLLLTIGLVVGVIFMFLRNIPATIISSLALPMAIVGTFAVMAWLGFSLDNISLMALTLSVGFVVDDAIVVLENIIRHIEMGKPPFQAALDGSAEIGFTVLSMTISLVAVFIPILLMGGIIGRLFNEFAVTISVAILVSGVISLTLTPMLCSRFLKGGAVHEPTDPQGRQRWSTRILGSFEWALDKLFAGYKNTLEWALRHKPVVMLGFVVMLVLTGWLFMLVPKGFIPTEDSGQISGSTEGPQGISFNEMVRHQTVLADIASKNPNVASVMSSVDQSNTGRLFMVLKPIGKGEGERTAKADEVLAQLRPKMSQVPGIKAFLQVPATLRIGGQSSKSQYQYTLQSPNLEDLYKAANTMQTRMKGIPGMVDVTTDQQNQNPQAIITIDRNKATLLGVSVSQVEEALSSAYSTRQVSIFYTPNNDYQVILEVDPKYQKTTDTLSLLYVRANSGTLVPLGTLARVESSQGALTVNHLGQFPSVTLSYNLQPGVSLGSVAPKIDALAREILPSSVRASAQGTAQAFQSSMGGTLGLIVLAILVIYLVLGILYESFIHPITILSGLPSAGLGALLTLMLFNQELNLYGFLGLLMLIGIVKKNAIMMVDFALATERSGKQIDGREITAAEAIHEACLVRFRPIMMTTMAALMGTLPIAMAWGGGEARQSLGLVVFGGLLMSQLVTLYITPVIYIYLDRFTPRSAGQAPEKRISPSVIPAHAAIQ